MNISRAQKYFATGLCLTAIVAGGFWSCAEQPQGPIYQYSASRDRQGIIDLFKQNWYWLTATKDFSTEFMLDNRAPDKNIIYSGHLQMRVLRENNTLVGFVAYYMKTKDLGWLLFLVIDEAYRGQRKAETLATYAIDQMRLQGAKKVRLVTRTDNVSAQRVYRRLGFTQYKLDPTGFVYFEYTI